MASMERTLPYFAGQRKAAGVRNEAVKAKEKEALGSLKESLSVKPATLISISTVVVIIGLWTVLSLTGRLNSRVIPDIRAVFAAIASISTEGYKGATLLGHLSASFFRLFSAFFLAIVTAIPLGLWSGQNEKIRALLEPIVEFVRPLPPLAYYTLLVLWMGIDNESKIMLLYLACFTPIYVACVSAVTKIPDSYLYVARTLGADGKNVFWRVILPYTAPDIFTGIRTSIGHGYSTLVAAEMVAAASGVGWMVLDASNWLRNDVVFAGIIVMGITGILIDRILKHAELKLVPWKGKL